VCGDESADQSVTVLLPVVHRLEATSALLQPCLPEQGKPHLQKRMEEQKKVIAELEESLKKQQESLKKKAEEQKKKEDEEKKKQQDEAEKKKAEDALKK
jgi:membrane protein involved in colicin uptake